jgi:hypothetical protein
MNKESVLFGMLLSNKKKIILDDVCKKFYMGYRLHRLDGPAVEFFDKSYARDEYWVKGKFIGLSFVKN